MSNRKRASEEYPIYLLHPGHVRSASDGDLHYISPEALLRLYSVPHGARTSIAGTSHFIGMSEKDKASVVHLWPDPLGKYDLEHPFDPSGRPPRFQSTEEADAWLEQRARVERIQRGEGELGSQGRPISAPPGSLADTGFDGSAFIQQLKAAPLIPAPPAPTVIHPQDFGGSITSQLSAKLNEQRLTELLFGEPVRPPSLNLDVQTNARPGDAVSISGVGPFLAGMDTVTFRGRTYQLTNGKFTDDQGVTYTLD